MEKRREDDVGAQKMKERLSWGAAMAKEVAEEQGFPYDKEVFIKGLEAGISMFIQSEKR